MKARLAIVAVFVALGSGISFAIARSADHAGETTQVNQTSDFTVPGTDRDGSGFDFTATTEQIRGYRVDLDVRPDGDMRVTEVIDYQFGVVPKHGIFRDVVVRERYDDRYDRVYPFDLVSVAAGEGTPADVELQEEGNFRRIRIGDPDRTITGRHRYVIVYDLENVITGFEDHDELFWDAIGAEWSVPIDRAVVTVSMPGAVTDIRCFAGGRGSQDQCVRSTSEGDTATFIQEDMSSGQGLTVVVGVEPGLIDDNEPILDERWSLARAFSVNGGTAGVAGGLALLAVGGVALLIHRHGRDRRFVGSATDVAFGNQTGAEERVPLQDGDGELIPVEFVPPDGIRPGQLGTLVDEVAHPVDVTASIVDLASRGYLRIEEMEGRKQNWRFIKLKDPDDDLLEYEQILFKGLFPPGGRTDVTLGQLRTKFHTHLARVQNALYEDLVARGWYTHRPDRVRAFWYAIAAGALLVAGGVLAALIIWTHWALVGIPLVVAALVLLIGARWMPSRSPAGTGMLRRVLGFRRFIEESEQDRARFAEQQHLFTEYLPYAVALGATEKWAKAFAGLGEEPPQPDWYVGHHPWSVMLFAGSMNDFSVSTSGTMTSVPASSGGSSGFSGGGGVGGGGGGGGGGSW